MIIVKLLGGLGNHLFQYAAGLNLAVKHNVKIKLDQSLYDTYRSHAIGLHHFNIECRFATKEDLAKFYSNKIIRIINNRRIFSEKYFHFDPGFYHCPPNTYLDGYWQSEKYFNEIKDRIKNEFKVKQKQVGKDKILAAEISNSESVALHVRRGNYLSSSAIYDLHGVCSSIYYDKCIEYVTQKLNNPHLYVFADDKRWARNNLKFNLKTTFVDHNDASLDYEDLRLMSQCKHQIIANSTFSWWAAWLNENPNKIVLAPENWFNKSEKNTKDLIPEQWIRI